jgi:hypothetical protein
MTLCLYMRVQTLRVIDSPNRYGVALIDTSGRYNFGY